MSDALPAELTAAMTLDFPAHRQRLWDALPGDGIVILFSGRPLLRTADEEYRYAPNHNYYYLTGLDRENQVLVLTRRGSERTATLFIEPVDPRAEAWTGRMMTAEQARSLSNIDDVATVDRWLPHVNRLIESGHYPDVYLDLEHREWAGPPSDAVRFAHRLVEKHPGTPVRNVFPILAELRRIKSAGEIARVRAAIAHTKAGLAAILAHTRPGVREYQLNGHFTGTLIGGGVRTAYPPIIATGANAAVLHYTTLRDTVQPGEVLLVDAAAAFAYYKADITRTFPADGTFTNAQRAIHDLVGEASHEVMAAMRPGVLHRELQTLTRRVLGRGMKALGYLRDESEIGQYYFHGVSHYLGLDTHDVGEYRELEPGMVLTVEPGLYLKDQGLGVRIEDDVLITANGVEVLSDGIPQDARAMERWMAELQASPGS